jgi:hypothetical protein
MSFSFFRLHRFLVERDVQAGGWEVGSHDVLVARGAGETEGIGGGQLEALEVA